MIRNKVSIERQIDDKLYQFVIPFDAVLSETLSVIDDVRKQIVNIIEIEEKKAQEKQALEPQKEE